ncbi:hypothetical protein BDQ17DRAFT_1417894 [Cyathus striatus]|nr:hypothetical protein BDQ17DRAFT_1417894 [Cyathus striatus]
MLLSSKFKLLLLPPFAQTLSLKREDIVLRQRKGVYTSRTSLCHNNKLVYFVSNVALISTEKRDNHIDTQHDTSISPSLLHFAIQPKFSPPHSHFFTYDGSLEGFARVASSGCEIKFGEWFCAVRYTRPY